MTKIRLNRKQVYRYGLILFFFIYIVLGSLVAIVVPNTYLRVGIEWVGFAALFLLSRREKIRILHNEIIPFFLVVVWGYINGSQSAVFDLTIMIPFLLLVVVLKEHVELIPDMYMTLLKADFIYAITTIVLSFSRTIYEKLTLVLFPTHFSRLMEWYDNGYMAGITSHYSINGILLTTGMILSYCRMTFFQDRNDKLKGWGQLLIFVVAVLLTGKRGVAIFGSVSILIGYYLKLTAKKKSRLIYVIKRSLMVLCGIAVLMVLIPPLRGIFTRFSETIQQGDVTLGRIKYWHLAFEIFCTHPLFGIGWGNFGAIAEQVYGKNIEAHNVYIQLLCETGIVGAGALLMFSVSLLRRAISKLKEWVSQEKHKLGDGSWLLFSCCYQVFFLLYCLSGTPLYSPTAYMPYFFACGIAQIDV